MKLITMFGDVRLGSMARATDGSLKVGHLALEVRNLLTLVFGHFNLLSIVMPFIGGDLVQPLVKAVVCGEVVVGDSGVGHGDEVAKIGNTAFDHTFGFPSPHTAMPPHAPMPPSDATLPGRWLISAHLAEPWKYRLVGSRPRLSGIGWAMRALASGPHSFASRAWTTATYVQSLLVSEDDRAG
jgi:hypothetical protein